MRKYFKKTILFLILAPQCFGFAEEKSGVKNILNHINIEDNKQICDAATFVRQHPWAILNNKVTAGVSLMGLSFLTSYIKDLEIYSKKLELEHLDRYFNELLETGIKGRKEIQARIIVLEKRIREINLKEAVLREKALKAGVRYRVTGHLEKASTTDPVLDHYARIYKNDSMEPLVRNGRPVRAEAIEFLHNERALNEFSLRSNQRLLAKLDIVKPGALMEKSLRLAAAIRGRVMMRIAGFAGAALLLLDGYDAATDVYNILNCTAENIRTDPLSVFSSAACMSDKLACDSVLKTKEMRQMVIDAYMITRREQKIIKDAGLQYPTINEAPHILLSPPNTQEPSRRIEIVR